MTVTRFDAHAPIDDLHAALERDGAVILEEATVPEVLEHIDRDLAPWLERPVDASPLGNNVFTGFRTLRTSGLIAKSAACGELAMHSRVLELVDRTLGPQCARFQLSFTQAIKIGPGEQAQAVHRDTTMYPFRRPGPEAFVNAIWALTDFTEENGATRIYPGSHQWPEGRLPTAADAWVAAAMPRGSVVVYLGSCFHGGGANQTRDAHRTGIAFGYTLGWLRQEENQYLAVPPDKARTLPVELQRLIGYAEHSPFLGWYEGADPAVAHGGPSRKRYSTELVGGASKSIPDILSEGAIANQKAND
jgi:hypothetical protein